MVGTQEDFLACMKLRMANILVEAEAVVAAMAVQNGLRRQSGATDTSDQRRAKWFCWLSAVNVLHPAQGIALYLWISMDMTTAFCWRGGRCQRVDTQLF